MLGQEELWDSVVEGERRGRLGLRVQPDHLDQREVQVALE